MGMTQDRSITRIDIPRLITVQVAGFVLFHLNQEILFTASFQRAIYEHEWIGSCIATFGSWTWLFGPGVAVLWWVSKNECNRPIGLGFAGVTFYCAYSLQYPILTSILYLLGQIDPFPFWMFDNMPTGVEIFGS